MAAPASVAPAAPTAVDAVDRTKTLILDMDSGRDLTPDVWNPYLPSAAVVAGLHQAILEPLFMLNYETGQILPWIGESMTSNATRTSGPSSSATG